MFGASSPYLQPHHFQSDTTFRALKTSFPNFTAYRKNNSITSGVRNKQEIVELIGTYQINRQASISYAMPIVNTSFSFLYGSVPKSYLKLPTLFRDPLHNRPRTRERGRGIGDMTLVAHTWLLPTRKYLTGNVQVGAGLKVPSGHFDEKSVYPRLDGSHVEAKSNDQSIQPGDGGYGIILDISAFKTMRLPLVKAATMYGFGTYLINPRNSNGVPSIIQGLLGPQAGQKALPAEITNSVTDQYLGELGATVPVPWINGLYYSHAARIEGVPTKDWIGGSSGFRRPGLVLFQEPGFSYSYGKNVWSFSMPVRVFQNIMTVQVDHRHADATIPHFIFLARYTRRI